MADNQGVRATTVADPLAAGLGSNDHQVLLSILDSLDALVYVSDFENHRILFANRYVRETFGNIVGQQCWESLQQNQQGPCHFCTNDKLLDRDGEPAGIYSWEFCNTVTGRWYAIRDRAIRWPDGRLVRLEIALDITDRKTAERDVSTAASEVARFSRHLRELHRISLTDHEHLDGLFEHYLAAGCRMFDMATGVIGRQVEDRLVVLAVVSGNEAIAKGARLPLSETQCRQVLETGMTVVIHGEDGTAPLADDDARRCPLQARISAPIYVDGHLYGALCFGAAADTEKRFDHHDTEIIEIMAQSIGARLGKRRAEERQRFAEHVLHEERDRAQATLTSISDGVIRTNTAGEVEFINAKAESLTGWRGADALGVPLDQVVRMLHEETGEVLGSPLDGVLGCGSAVPLSPHAVLLHRYGHRRAVEGTAAALRDRSGRISGSVVVFRDVTDARRLAHRLSYQATHDGLTGLINRQEFERRLAQLCDAPGGAGEQHTLFYLDLDRFKVVNDTCGHVAGDELLRQLSAVLQSQLRQADSLARLGGDEFGLLLEQCPLGEALRVAEALKSRVEDFRFTWGGRSFAVGVSIGAVSIGDGDDSAAALMRAADAACYAAKEKGRNRVYIYQPNDAELMQRHGEMQWISRIPDAVEGDQFVLFAQPIVSLKEDCGPRLQEVLVRMVDDNGSLIPPAAFIPAAERYHLMRSVDRWVLRNALRAAPALDPSGEVILSVNLSASSLIDETLAGYVREQLAACRFDPRRLCFEITETAAIGNLVQAIEFITELKSLGCRFALDDFGSGMSSFAYLKNLPVDFIKIDGNFVRGVATDNIDRAMVAAITQVAHEMGIKTVAEYAETQGILDTLRQLGVDYAQGYGIDTPRPIPDVVAVA